VLLLDEPFGALDAGVRAELREWLRRLHEEVHVTTVFVTHDQQEAMAVSDQIAILNAGRIEQIGSPRELYDEPASEFVMRFVGDAHPFGGGLVRPHDLDVLPEPEPGAVEAQVSRVTLLGFEARVHLHPAEGDEVSVQLTRRELDELELAPGDIVWIRATRAHAVA
jgi:sulfate transport system ATP-binding protein